MNENTIALPDSSTSQRQAEALDRRPLRLNREVVHQLVTGAWDDATQGPISRPVCTSWDPTHCPTDP